MSEEKLIDTLFVACDVYNTEILKYILTVRELMYYITPDIENDLILITACQKKDKDLINFLFTSKELIGRPNLKEVVEFFYYTKKIDILIFLLNECSIQNYMTPKLEKFVKEHKDLDILFFKHQLSNNLSDNNTIKKKTKI